MIRKLVLGLAAAVVVAGTSLRHDFRVPRRSASTITTVITIIITATSSSRLRRSSSRRLIPPSCLQKRLVQTYKGLRWRTVNVCAF